MKSNKIRNLKLLDEISVDGHIRQRELAKKHNISLGLVNSSLKLLKNKGYLKVTESTRKRFGYALTSEGKTEKVRLAYEYLKYASNNYAMACNKIESVFQEFTNNNNINIVFYGAGELAQVAYQLIQQTSLKLVGIIDPYRHSIKFKGMEVMHPDEFTSDDYDMVFITELIDGQDVSQISDTIKIDQSLFATIK